MAKIIMVQGTASGAGKSILTTALCRIFTQDGYKTAPFKSQNMTAIAHELADGGKMARSQAIAAYACKSEPTTDMNPVLLMMSDNGTEVIVCGKSMGIMSHYEYKEYKKGVFAQVLTAFNRLSESHDIIVIEGAGSPVELNLNQNDIVNMGLAKSLNSPVLLVSDIMRGGVFASMYGTMELFAKDERQLVKGLVINKFKGNTEYFKDGSSILEDLCGVPVLGVIPFTDVMIEDEDSLDCTEKEKLSISDMQNEFDRIAEHFRKNLNMTEIYRILGGEV